MITFNEDQLSEELAYIVENDLLIHAVSTQLAQKESVKIINEVKVENISLASSTVNSESIIQIEGGNTIKTNLLVSKKLHFT